MPVNVDYYVKRNGKFYRILEESEFEICVVETFAYADGKTKELEMWWWKKDLDKIPSPTAK